MADGEREQRRTWRVRGNWPTWQEDAARSAGPGGCLVLAQACCEGSWRGARCPTSPQASLSSGLPWAVGQESLNKTFNFLRASPFSDGKRPSPQTSQEGRPQYGRWYNGQTCLPSYPMRSPKCRQLLVPILASRVLSAEDLTGHAYNDPRIKCEEKLKLSLVPLET